MVGSSNALRFINAYNKIDGVLRSIFRFNPSMAFSDMIRKSSELNHTVAKYEDELLDYGRLRNAIVHKTIDGRIIAEPHDDVTEKIEKIARLLTQPPRIVDTICKGRKRVIVVDGKDTIKNVLMQIDKYQYSNLPIYMNGQMQGIVNNKLLTTVIARVVSRGDDIDDFIARTQVRSIVSESMYDVYYTIMDESATLQDVIQCFDVNKKMQAIILTKRGTRIEDPIGIVTGGDVLEIADILTNYD